MSLTKYDNYKDSGVEWLGNIPAHWTFGRIKTIGSVNGRVGWKALKASEYVDSGYFFLATPNIKERNIDYENVNYITYERFIESPEIILKEDDILLTKDGSTLGTVNIVKNLPGSGTINSSIAVLRFKKVVNNDYVYFLIVSDYIQNLISQKKDGMGVPHLFQKDINNFLLLVPHLYEQTAIATYLNSKTYAIDRKVSLLEQKITYYQKLRKSLICETVCRSLDKNVKLKDSGIEWIGRIPEHWEVKRVDLLFSERSEKVSDSDYMPLSITMNGVLPQIESVAKTLNGDNRKKVLVGDFVINSRSDRRGASGFSKFQGSVSVISIVLKPKKQIHCEYYHYFFKCHKFTEEFYKLGKGIVDDLWSTKFSVLRTFEICFPSKTEQIAIATYLDEKTQKIDSIISNIKNQIETLKELRKTLINDVVTGKIKVTQ